MVRGLSSMRPMNTRTPAPIRSIRTVHWIYVVAALLRHGFLFFTGLLLLLGIATLAIPQVPSYITQENDLQAWTLQTIQQHPYLAPLAPLGIFKLTRSPLMLAVLLGMIVTAILHQGYAFYLGWWPRGSTHIPPLSPQAAESGRLVRVVAPLADISAQVENHLRRFAPVRKEHPSFQETRYFVRYGRGAIVGSIIFFLGTAIVGVSIYLNITLGWETPPTVLAPAQPWTPGHNIPLRVTLQRVDPSGENALFLLQKDEPGGQTTAQQITPNHTLNVGNVHIRFWDAPLGVRITVTAQAQTALPLITPDGHAGREAILFFPESGDERTVLIPTYGYTVRVVGYERLPSRGYAGPVFLVQLLGEGSDTPLYTEFVTQPTQVRYKNLHLNIELVRHARVQAIYTPGSPWRWLGLLLILLGTGTALWWGPWRRFWVQLYESRSGLIVQIWADMYNVGWHIPDDVGTVYLSENLKRPLAQNNVPKREGKGRHKE